MKNFLFANIFILLSFSTKAQIALAKLKFEDAEQAYNVGNYTAALTKLKDAEKLFGKINPPILHLTILVQDKLIQQTKNDYTLIFDLKKNCQQFLKTYDEVEGLEDKYRDVYKLSEKYSSLPSNYEELNLYLDNQKKEYQERCERFKKILLDYINEIGGESLLRTINTLSYSLDKINASRKEADFSVEVRIINQQKMVRDGKSNRFNYFEYLDTQKGFVQLNKFQPTNRTLEEVEANADVLSIFLELSLLDKLPDSIKITQESNNEEICNVLQFFHSKYHSIKIFFSQKDKLKKRIEHVYYFCKGETVKRVHEIISYINVNGIKFVSEYTLGLSGAAPGKYLNTDFKLNPEFKLKSFEN